MRSVLNNQQSRIPRQKNKKKVKLVDLFWLKYCLIHSQTYARLICGIWNSTSFWILKSLSLARRWSHFIKNFKNLQYKTKPQFVSYYCKTFYENWLIYFLDLTSYAQRNNTALGKQHLAGVCTEGPLLLSAVGEFHEAPVL